MKFFAVPHQHFDLIWRRDVADYRQRRFALYAKAIALLENDPRWCFTFCQSWPLREFVDAHPEYCDKIKKLLAQGRLEMVGGAMSIPDVNMSSPGAVLQNCESGRKYLRETFDHEVVIGSFEDAFGIPAQLPALLKAANYTYYKLGRMPRADADDAAGDMIWRATNGETIRCIGNIECGMSWGWGFSHNPDDPVEDIYAKRYANIRREFVAGIEKALEQKLEYALFTVMGEEQAIFTALPELVEDLGREYADRGVEMILGTYSQYLKALPPGYWDTVPIFDDKTDFSRLFTGCYTSRIASKLLPRRLEYAIYGAEAAGTAVPESCYDTLALLQFHDAICGCHIDENAHFLRDAAQQALGILEKSPKALPFPATLPDFKLPAGILEQKFTGELAHGQWRFDFAPNGRFVGAIYNGRNYGTILHPILREEHGTLWTQEYGSGRYEPAIENESPAEVTRSGDLVKISVAFFDNRFRSFWPGLTQIRYRKILTFRADSPLVAAEIEIEFSSNSTEISLAWGNLGQRYDQATAETPCGTKTHGQYPMRLMTGPQFPALNFVRTGDFAVFNSGTPGHVVRDGHVESVVLRSPVKRWAPPFPVTPSVESYDNSAWKFQFLFVAEGGQWSMARCHRTGIEFNLKCATESFSVCDAELPEEWIPVRYDRFNRQALLFNASTLAVKAVSGLGQSGVINSQELL